jgi:hypothetical protein
MLERAGGWATKREMGLGASHHPRRTVRFGSCAACNSMEGELHHLAGSRSADHHLLTGQVRVSPFSWIPWVRRQARASLAAGYLSTRGRDA